LVLDDLQWADQPSLLLLEFLASQLPGKKILILGTYRDIEVNREHPLSRTLAQLSRSDSYHREGLGGLELEYTGQLISDISGAEPSQELVQAIFGHTDGNPFFMTEIIRLLEEKRRTGDQTATTGLEELEIPPSVLEVIGQRLNRLSAECEDVLTTAAVIGREFDFELLRTLSQETAESQLLASIDEALDASLVQEVAGQRDVYQFSHALVQQTLRERLSNSRRVRLHLKIAETLETLFGDRPDEYAAELAYHFAEAAPVAGTAKLVQYAMLAGERALETHAHEEALGHFQRGLIAKGLDLEGSSPAPDPEAAGLLYGLGRTQAATLIRQDLDVAFASLQRAFDFYAATKDVARAVEFAGYPLPAFPGNHLAMKTVARALQLVPSDSPEAGYLLSRSVLVMGLEEGDYPGAIEAYSNALEIVRRTGDLALEIRILAQSSMVDLWHLRWEETIEKGLRAIALTETTTDQASRLSANYWTGVALLHSGEPEAAQRHASDMLSIAKDIRDRYWLATAQWILESAATYKGDWQIIRNFNEPGLLVSPSDNRLLGTRMLMEFEIGNETEGHELRERLLATLRQVTPGPKYEQSSAALMIPLVARITGGVHDLSLAESLAAAVLSSEFATPLVSRYARLGLGMVAVIRGDGEAAKEQYDNLVSAVGCFHKISTDRVLGLLAQTMGELDQAFLHFEAAAALCGKAGYKPELAWSRHDHAGALLERNEAGDQARAIDLLDEAMAIASELPMRPLMARLTAIRETVDSLPAQTSASPDGLTLREIDAIRLVAAGRTDREIAEELIIGVRTVNTHVSNILNKTGAANRAEAASYAVLHNLN
jgi:DNA-binding CsgD family transcriptional regulator